MEQLHQGWLRQARRNTHMTLKEVGSAIGRNPSQIWRWETGKSQVKIEMLLKLCELYGVSIIDILKVEEHT